jgi:hypothetical protein
MKPHRLVERELSAKAEELIEFDMDSIRQIAASQHLQPPEVWIIHPDQYEKAGRIQRDSTSARMLAYSPERNIVFATDGCNSCAHFLNGDLKIYDHDALLSFAAESEIQLELVEGLAGIVQEPSGR